MARQHQSSRMRKVLAELDRLGFHVERAKSGVYKILPPPGIEGPMYTTHGTESALHPMRRDFKRYYNIDLHI
jgi:predicted transcriptional regulator of viral defense system